MPGFSRFNSWSNDFGPFNGHIWLNAAHQGAMPKAAADAAYATVQQKLHPYKIHDDSFLEIPQRLRAQIAQLIDADSADIVLGNSATYGLDLLARALPFQPEDEVLLVDGEFPASVFPFRVREQDGVQLRFMTARTGFVPTADELCAQISERTRVFCTSWVNSFSGHAADLNALGRVCRDRSTLFIVNGSQGVGAKALSIKNTQADAVVCCGYKWLLGPYGTGFVWISPNLQKMLCATQAYWLPNVWGKPQGLRNYDIDPKLGLRAYDVCGTANFLNFAPWIECLSYLNRLGIEAVENWITGLIDTTARLLDVNRWELLLPTEPARRSGLLYVRPRSRKATEIYQRLSAKRIHTSLREGLLRLSPHIYNTRDEIELAAAAMNDIAG
jgi:cysteine desulfurase/selenocysteine lyase